MTKYFKQNINFKILGINYLKTRIYKFLFLIFILFLNYNFCFGLKIIKNPINPYQKILYENGQRWYEQNYHNKKLIFPENQTDEIFSFDEKITFDIPKKGIYNLYFDFQKTQSSQLQFVDFVIEKEEKKLIFQGKKNFLVFFEEVGEYNFYIKSRFFDNWKLKIYETQKNFPRPFLITPNTNSPISIIDEFNSNLFIISNNQFAKFFGVKFENRIVNDFDENSTEEDFNYPRYFDDKQKISVIDDEKSKILLQKAFEYEGNALISWGYFNNQTIVFASKDIFNLEKDEIKEILLNLKNSFSTNELSQKTKKSFFNQINFLVVLICFGIFMYFIAGEFILKHLFGIKLNKDQKFDFRIIKKICQIIIWLFFIGSIFGAIIFGVLIKMFDTQVAPEFLLNIQKIYQKAGIDCMKCLIIDYSKILLTPFLIFFTTLIVIINNEKLKRLNTYLKNILNDKNLWFNKWLILFFSVTFFASIIFDNNLKLTFFLLLLLSIYVQNIIKTPLVFEKKERYFLYTWFFVLGLFIILNFTKEVNKKLNKTIFQEKLIQNPYDFRLNHNLPIKKDIYLKKTIHSDEPKILNFTSNIKSKNNIFLNFKNKEQESILFYSPFLDKFTYKKAWKDVFIYAKNKISQIQNFNDYLLNQKNIKNIGINKDLVFFDTYTWIPEDKFMLNTKDFYKHSLKIDKTKETEIFPDLYENEYEFYTYLDKNLIFEVDKKDLNQIPGADNLNIVVYDTNKSKTIAFKQISDDKKDLGENGAIQTEKIEIDNLNPGIYKIEFFSNNSYVDAEVQDFVIKRIKINSPYFVVRGENLKFQEGPNLYFENLEKRISINNLNREKIKPQEELSISLHQNDKEIQKINFLDQTRKKQIYFSDPKKLYELQLHKNEIILDSPLNFYSFTKDSYFYPYKFYFEDIKETNDIFIDKGNITVSENLPNNTIKYLEKNPEEKKFSNNLEKLKFQYFDLNLKNKSHLRFYFTSDKYKDSILINDLDVEISR